MSMIQRPIPLIALAGLAIAGCNDDQPFFPFTDAAGADATGGDASTSPDGGVLPDGMTLDTGDDTGPVTDGGTDAGPAPDTGTDAGPAPDTGTDAGPAPDTGTDVGPAPDTGTDATPFPGLRELIEAYCTAQAECEGTLGYVDECVGYFSRVEAALAQQTEACRRAVVTYLGCAITSEEACYEDDYGTYFDGERGCELEQADLNRECPEDI